MPSEGPSRLPVALPVSPLTDAELRATALPVILPPGGSGLTDAELRAAAVPVLVAPIALDAATLLALETIVATGPLTNAELRLTPVPIVGSVSASGPLTDAQLRAAAVPVSGPLTDAQLRAVAVPVSLAVLPPEAAATLAVTATAAAAAAATLTLPAAGAGLFHYITHLQIVKYNTAAASGSATPVLVSSTNLPGSPVWTFPRVGVIGTVAHGDIQPIGGLTRPLRSNAANVNTTIVCPATTAVLWRITAHYYTAI